MCKKLHSIYYFLESRANLKHLYGFKYWCLYSNTIFYWVLTYFKYFKIFGMKIVTGFKQEWVFIPDYNFYRLLTDQFFCVPFIFVNSV